MFSKRTQWPASTDPLIQLWEQRLQSGLSFYDLSLSNPTKTGFDYSALATESQSFENSAYHADPKGQLVARQAISEYYQSLGIVVPNERIFITCGTSESYSYLLRLLCNPTDKILVPSPGYPLLDVLSQLNDIEQVPYELDAQNAWQPKDLDPQMLDARLKAIVCVNPNNPTGNYLSDETLSVWTKRCEGRSIALISDEVFFDYPLKSGESRRSAASSSDMLSFTLGGVSKMMGLPQAKLAWIVVSGPQHEAQEACRRLEIISDSYLSANALSMNLLPTWMSRRHYLQSQILERIQINRAYLDEQLKDHDLLELLPSQGGWYAVLRCKVFFDESRLCYQLFERHNIFMHPGYFFGFETGRYLVISLLNTPSCHAQAVHELLKQVRLYI